MLRGFLKKAAPTGVAFFFLSVCAAGPRPSEGPQDLIEKAQNLILQKERGAAIQLLVGALRRESPKSAAAKEMKAALAGMTTLFFSDKSQQLYELALTFRRTDVTQAQQRVAEALRQEPQNSLLIAEAGRLSIMRGDCASAQDLLRRAKEKNPFDELILLTLAQAALCQSDIPEYASVRSLADAAKGPYAREWAALEVERALIEKAESRARENIENLLKTEAGHPEIQFWRYQLEKNSEKKKAHALKYAHGCKSMPLSVARKYLNEVSICRRLIEIEEFLGAKSDGSSSL